MILDILVPWEEKKKAVAFLKKSSAKNFY